jgi:DNA-binding response OmpR family regulator
LEATHHQYPGSYIRTEVYDDGCLRVEYGTYFVACKGNHLDLTKKEFLLVFRLARNIERIVTFQDLWEHAWPVGKPLNRQSLHVYMCKVRGKLAEYGLRIENMINVGYSLAHGECCARTSGGGDQPGADNLQTESESLGRANP